MNKEFFDAIDLLVKEKGIQRETLMEGIKAALLKSCEQFYGTSENIVIEEDEENRQFRIYRELEVVDHIEEGMEKMQVLPDKAALLDPSAHVGSIVREELDPQNFSRIAAQNGKSIILQKIREEERQTVSDYFEKHKDSIMTGIVSRVMRDGMVSVNLGKADAVLTKEDMIPGETFAPGDHIKVYVVAMRDQNGRGPRVHISRTKAGLVKKLFEQEVTEIKEGIVEIKAITREAGSRTKIAVYSKDENVDPIGACIGVNGTRINAIVDELAGEKIDIIKWDETPEIFISNALSPASVYAVAVENPEERKAIVVVYDNQLSLAIGMKGQNARLAAHLTGYKIDIKSLSQAEEEGLFDEGEEADAEGEGYEESEEGYEEGYEEASEDSRDGE